MRIAVLYDIHGNFPALEAVLNEVSSAGVDCIVVGGDVIPGPMPRECLDRVAALNVETRLIIGNGDRESVAAKHGTMSNVIPPYFREAMLWNGAQLTEEDERMIALWPLTARLHVGGIGDVVFCHATPRNDQDIFVVSTDEQKLQPLFDPLDAPLVVCGHTHMQFDRRIGRTRVVNAGSVGMPFQPAGAYWLLIDAGMVELRRTAYDLDDAARRVRATAYPLAEDFAQKIAAPPEERAMLAAFSTAELK